MLVAIAVALGAAPAQDWADLPPLTADPAVLLAAAAGAEPDEHGAHILLDEVTVRLEPGGLTRRDYHRVYVVTTRSGADEWGILGAGYAAWHERPPTLTARVITPDGAEHALDPSHVTDGVDGGEGDVLSDRRTVRAPLPSMEVGAVVEQHVVVEAHTPYFDAGQVETLPLWTPWPVDRRRVTVVAARHVDFESATWPPTVEPVSSREAGERRLVVDLDGRTFVAEGWEPDRPDDEPTSALFVSTARDWQAIALQYAGLVDAEIALAEADLAARAARARGDAKARDDIAARMLEAVREMRHVAVELGATAIRPRSPATAFQNGYGDCKDKAVALVGLLRASGVDADVALVRVGPGPDIAPLPGLNDFDHMIAVVHGDPPLWIDPTSDYAQLGDLPLGDQGRRALIVDPSTRGPVETPVLPADRAVHRYERTVRLGRRGKGVVDEVQTMTGWIAESSRWDHLGATAEQVDAFYEDRAQDTFSGTLAGAVETDGADPAGFRVHVAMEDAGAAFTAEDEAAAQVAGWDVLHWLPEWLYTEGEPRRGPLAFSPHRVEIVERVVPPEGFVLDEEPAPFAHTFGPVTWTQAVAREPDGVVVVTLRFDTGTGRLEPADAQALWDEIVRYGQQDRELVIFRDPATIAAAEGKVGEAVVLARDAARAHPDDGHRVDRYGRMLLAAGFADAAVEQGERAVALLPDDADVVSNLAYTRLHDRFGRLVGPGFDRAGAIADAERALALDPDLMWAWQVIAIASEAGDDGKVYGPGSDLARSIDALRERRRRGDVTDLDAALANHLARAERWDELSALVPDLDPAANPLRYQVLVAAAEGGAEAALVVPLARADDALARAALGRGVVELYRRRDYPGAARLLEAAARRADDPTVLAPALLLLERSRRTEDLTLSDTDPADVVRRFLAMLMLGASEKELRAAVMSHELAGIDLGPPPDPASLLQEIPLPLELGTLRVERPHLADLTLAGTTFRVEGDRATGWRVTCVTTATGQVSGVTWLVEEKGKPRIRALREASGEAGVEAATRLARGDEAGARRWLEWLRDLAPVTNPADPFDGSPFTIVLPRDPEVAADIAAVEQLDRTKRAVKDLLAARARADADVALQIDRALLRGHTLLEAWDEAWELALRLHREHPASAAPIEWMVHVAARSDRRAEALPIVRAAADANPTKPALLRAHAATATGGGDIPGGRASYEAIFALGQGTASDYNEAAWYSLPDPALHARGVEWAMRANELGRYDNAAHLHTLATLLVEVGRVDEAHGLYLKGVKGDDRTDAQLEAWVYLQGRLAEAWGMPEVARERYASLPPPEEDDTPLSTRRLAQERLR